MSGIGGGGASVKGNPLPSQPEAPLRGAGARSLRPEELAKSPYASERVPEHASEASALTTDMRNLSLGKESSQYGVSLRSVDAEFLPRGGVTLGDIDEYIADSGGARALVGTRTSDVLTKLFAATLGDKMSYAESLAKKRGVKTPLANVFVSHAHALPFLDMFAALKDHLADTVMSELPVLWIDVFCINQHDDVERNVFYWSTAFARLVRSIGNTLLVEPAPAAPLSFTRLWCAWETYISVSSGCKFDVAVCKAHKSSFLAAVQSNNEIVYDTVPKVDASNCVTSQPSDREEILSTIVDEHGTFSSFNATVSSHIRRWYFSTCGVVDIDEVNDPTKLDEIALAYLSISAYRLSELFYLKSYNLVSVLHSVDDTRMMVALINLARVFEVQGKFSDAIPLYTRCLEDTEKKHGEKHVDTIRALSNLAELHKAVGNLSVAEVLYRRLETLFSAQGLKSSRSDVAIRNNLGSLYKSLGRLQEAEQMYTECVSLSKRNLGPTHKDTFISLNNLAELFKTQKKYVEAEKLLCECLEGKIAVLGKDDPSTITTMSNLAGLYKAVSKYKEAEGLYTECLRLGEKTGVDAAQNLAVMNNLALLLELLGRHEEAESMFLSCLKQREEKLGAAHPATVSTVKEIVQLYKNLGRYADAQVMHKRLF